MFSRYALDSLPRPCCFILPPAVLTRMAEEGDEEDRRVAANTLAASASMRSRRSIVGEVVRSVGLANVAFLGPPPGENRTVFDMENRGSSFMPGTKKRGEGDPPSDDDAVNQAYDAADQTYDFYKEVLKRNSVNGEGMDLVSSVHYGRDFDNAFWQGSQMVYGDGSGRFLAKGKLIEISVVAHEMTHGVTQFTAGLRYSKQSGALNESMSDVFGSLVKQRTLEQTADQADWLIGEGILGPSMKGTALRSMKAPGTAFEGDDQPGHMNGYLDLPDDNDPANDNGGVHSNSGIPNHAFYLVATELGGHAWERAGLIWYDTLTKKLKPTSDFSAAAKATIASAGELFKAGGDEEQAVKSAWEQVGVH